MQGTEEIEVQKIYKAQKINHKSTDDNIQMREAALYAASFYTW